MVSARNHPSTFPPSSDSPTKSLGRSTPDVDSPTPAATTKARAKGRPKQSASDTPGVWTHTPSNLTLIWLAISLPLVVWDTGYVLLRPYSMPGGSLHWPIWVPYELYGRVDYVYGFKALEEKNGFTAAQGMLNLVETLGYMAYLWIVWRNGSQANNTEGTGAPSRKSVGWIGAARSVGGTEAGVAVLIVFATAVMTLNKTVLYWLNEYYSGFDNIGHNDALSLVFLWIIPNGPWIVFPIYMIYVFGQEILDGLAIASGESGSIVRKTLAIKDE